MVLALDELPGDLRVALPDELEDELWKRVEDRGVGNVAGSTGFSRSRIYSWRSKDLFLPAGFVVEVLGEQVSGATVGLKGGGRSRVSRLEFPLPEIDELLTRVEASVTVNKEGVPVYIAGERSLAERFLELLDRMGSVPTSLYVRSRFELRYPKYMHRVFQRMSYEPVPEAMVDEKGVVEDGHVSLDRDVYSFGELGRLYSREKSLEIALQRGDSDEVKRLMAEEARDAREIF